MRARVDFIKILGAIDTPIDRELRKAIYKPLYTEHKGVRGFMDTNHPDTEFNINCLGARPDMLHSLIRSALFYKRKIADMARRENPALANKLNSALMSFECCRPAGIIQNIPANITCKRYAVCPFCRYRLGVKLYHKLHPHLSSDLKIAHLKLFIIIPENCFIEDIRIHKLRHILQTINKVHRCWPMDVTFSVPHYLFRKQEWALQTNIIALAEKDTKLPHLSSLLSAPAQWTYCNASAGNLARRICHSLRYSTALLHMNAPGDRLLNLLSITKDLRCRNHGFRRSSEVPSSDRILSPERIQLCHPASGNNAMGRLIK